MCRSTEQTILQFVQYMKLQFYQVVWGVGPAQWFVYPYTHFSVMSLITGSDQAKLLAVLEI